MLSVTELAVLLVLAVLLRNLYLTLSRFWWGDTGHRPAVHYRNDSRVCADIVRACSALTEKLVFTASYHPRYTGERSDETTRTSNKSGPSWIFHHLVL